MKAIRFDTPSVARAFHKLPDTARVALRSKLDAFAADEGGGRAKALRRREGARLRAGDYRVVVEATGTISSSSRPGIGATSIAEGLPMGVQFLTTSGGEELVVLSRDDFDALLARAGDDAAEDRIADRIVRRSRQEREARGGVMLPDWLSSAILAGQSPIAAARSRASLTVSELADRSSVSRSVLTRIESGRCSDTEAQVAALAAALEVDPEWLRD